MTVGSPSLVSGGGGLLFDDNDFSVQVTCPLYKSVLLCREAFSPYFELCTLRPVIRMAGFTWLWTHVSGRALVDPFSPDPCAEQGESRPSTDWVGCRHLSLEQQPAHSHSSLLTQVAVDFVRQGGHQTLEQHQSTPELQERVRALLDMALQPQDASVFSSPSAASSTFSQMM